MVGRFGFSPWLAMLMKPKVTIRAIVDLNPNYRLLLLAWLYGFCSLLGIAQNVGLGEKSASLLFVAPLFLLAPLWGFALFSFSSWFVFLSGKLLKGQARYREVRAAYAWSNVPLFFNAFFWVFLIVLFGKDLFAEATLRAALTNAKAFLLMGAVFGQVVFSIWSMVLYVAALAEVQRFSLFRSVFNLVLGGLLFFVLAAVISFLLIQTGLLSTEFFK
ncbi:MAG: YIP1 family protein [Parachlamydiales bacterium]|jgi:hypothetical protein